MEWNGTERKFTEFEHGSRLAYVSWCLVAREHRLRQSGPTMKQRLMPSLPSLRSSHVTSPLLSSPPPGCVAVLKAASSTIDKEKVHSAYVAAVELVRSLVAAIGPAADDGDDAASGLRCRAGEMRPHWSSLCDALAKKLGEKRPKAVAEADTLLRELAAAEGLVGPAFVAE